MFQTGIYVLYLIKRLPKSEYRTCVDGLDGSNQSPTHHTFLYTNFAHSAQLDGRKYYMFTSELYAAIVIISQLLTINAISCREYFFSLTAS